MLGSRDERTRAPPADRALRAPDSSIGGRIGAPEMTSSQQQKPLELILARNLLTSLSTLALLVDHEAVLVFYTTRAAAAVLGRSFEDAGRMTAEQWSAAFGPLDRDDEPIEVDRLAITKAIRGGRPAHGKFRIGVGAGERASAEASAFPIVA